MTLDYQHQDRLYRPIGFTRFSIVSRRLFAKRWHLLLRGAMARIGAGFNIFHEAIVTAKTRRAQRNRVFHEIPQQPLVLGDKWDF